MAEEWSSWGDTGPVIGVSASVTESKTTATVKFSFMYCRRYAYSATSSFTTTATAYVDDSYYDEASFQPYSSNYSVGTDYTLISGSRTFNKESSAYSVNLTFECTNWGNLTWNKINGNNSAAAQSATVTVTIPKISRVSAPTISTTSSIRVPSQNSFTVSWNAVSNASSYYVSVSDSSGASILSSTSTTSTSKSFTVSNLNNYRGRTFTAYVYAVGSGNYANSTTTSKVIATINSLPEYPTVSRQSSTSLTTQNSISFTVIAGNDADGQTTSLYFSFDGGATKEKFTSPLTITHDTTTGGGIVSGSNTISFYTYDGYEYSTATNKTFTATFAPVIGTITTTHTSIQDMNGSTTTYLASAAKISFTMTSGTPKIIKLYVRTGDSTSLSGSGSLVSSSFYTYNEETKIINIPSIAAITSIGNGKYYQFAFKVNDGTTDSTLSSWQSVKRKPLLPRLPTYSNYDNHADNSWGATAKTNYFKDRVTITFTNPSASSGYAKIDTVAIIATYSSISKEYKCSATSGSVSAALDLKQVNGNVSTTFKFKVVDVAGQIQTSDVKLTLTKSSELAFGGSTVNITNRNLKPMTNTDNFQISHPIAQASGTQNIVYIYNIKVGNNDKNIATTNYTSQITTDEIKVTISAENINAITKELAADYNSAFDAVITVTAADGFGITKKLNTSTFKVNFTEPPVFNNSNFNIKHDYYTARTSITSSTGTQITSSSSLDIRMINSREGIIFVLPKATDPNNDISGYRIFLSRNDFINESGVLKYNEVTFGQTPWLTIPYETLTKGVSDTNYFYYLFKASQYTKNEYFYFKLQAYDSTGNTSSEIICQNYIIGCRTASPVFSAGNIRVDRNGQKVILTYNFKITDLGGSAKSSGWDRNYYNNYPNFERNITGYNPKASLVIEIAPDQNFSTNVITSDPIIFEPTDNLGLADFTDTQCKFSGFAESHAKIFMRFTLTVSYGLQDSSTLATVVSVPQVYTYFGAVPTVAHRAHKVGINTNSLDQDDVLVVENYQGTKYVRFKGTDASNASKTYEITFDLLTGSITGAVIDCGSW